MIMQHLFKLFGRINCVNTIDFVFGQMMSNYISKNGWKRFMLEYTNFNISMDDKLPVIGPIKTK
jgi:hypothetical protein